MLECDIHIDDLKKMLWKDKKGEDKIDPILKLYTVLRKECKFHFLMNENPSHAAVAVVVAGRNRAEYFGH